MYNVFAIYSFLNIKIKEGGPLAASPLGTQCQLEPTTHTSPPWWCTL